MSPAAPVDQGAPMPVPVLPLALEAGDTVASPAARFCGTCGTHRQPEWVRCEACAARSERQFGAAAVAAEAEPDGISRIKSALGFYFALLGVSVLVLVATLGGVPEISVDVGGSVVMSVVVLVWCAASGPRSILRLLKPGPVWAYAAAVGAAACTITIAFVVIETMHRGLGVEKLSYSPTYLSAGYGMWIVFVLVAVQPAVFEELAFRGVILSSLTPTLSNVEAVLVSAMLFMTLHLSPANFPHTFAMGVAAGFLRMRTGSLLPCILLHFIHNAVVVGSEAYLGI